MNVPILIPPGVPAGASQVPFTASNGKKGWYWVWKKREGCWYWQTLSNNGQEQDEWAAREAARRWIRGE
jgi:hypothetical protein